MNSFGIRLQVHTQCTNDINTQFHNLHIEPLLWNRIPRTDTYLYHIIETISIWSSHSLAPLRLFECVCVKTVTLNLIKLIVLSGFLGQFKWRKMCVSFKWSFCSSLLVSVGVLIDFKWDLFDPDRHCSHYMACVQCG